MSCDLVIFDCDGVLVDSEPIANKIFTRTLRKLGFDWSYDEVCERFVGKSMTHCVEAIEAALGRSVPDDFLEDLQRETFQAFRDAPLQPVPGIRDLLDELNVPFCVASSGEFEKMNTTLGLTGLLPRFEGRMFSSVQVDHGKPAPDLFLLAARSCGVAPERCVVIEDSVPGVLAGLAAGMRVLGYMPRPNGQDLGRAGAEPFSSMGQVPVLIRAGV